MDRRVNIAILMATYNGERYLEEQLDSILCQTNHDWHLYVHDDGSTDTTQSILKEYATQHPSKVTIFEYPPQGGACRNFMSMLERVEADYYMFCDQDDVWHTDKVETEHNAMLKAEQTHQAVLVATDMTVVDSLLNVIAPSLWAVAGIYPELIRSFNDVAANTVVSGCTMMFNQSARRMIQPVTRHSTMHDAWIMCCIMKQGGHLMTLRRPTVMYRQHGNNTLGAQNVANRGLWERLINLHNSLLINYRCYRMLQTLDYGGVWKFVSAKLRYHQGIKDLKFNH